MTTQEKFFEDFANLRKQFAQIEYVTSQQAVADGVVAPDVPGTMAPVIATLRNRLHEVRYLCPPGEQDIQKQIDLANYRTRYALACHEAGHAIVALIVGITPCFVSIKHGPGRERVYETPDDGTAGSDGATHLARAHDADLMAAYRAGPDALAAYKRTHGSTMGGDALLTAIVIAAGVCAEHQSRSGPVTMETMGTTGAQDAQELTAQALALGIDPRQWIGSALLCASEVTARVGSAIHDFAMHLVANDTAEYADVHAALHAHPDCLLLLRLHAPLMKVLTARGITLLEPWAKSARGVTCDAGAEGSPLAGALPPASGHSISSER